MTWAIFVKIYSHGCCFLSIQFFLNNSTIILIKLVRRVSHHPLLPPTGQSEGWRRKRHHSRTHLWKRKQAGARKTKDRGQRLWQVRVDRYIVTAFMKLVAYKDFVLLLFIFRFFIEWTEFAKDEAQLLHLSYACCEQEICFFYEGSVPRTDPDLNYPLLGEKGLPCLVKVSLHFKSTWLKCILRCI